MSTRIARSVLLLAALVAIVAPALAGCGGEKADESVRASARPDLSDPAGADGGSLDGLDLGQDWDASARPAGSAAGGGAAAAPPWAIVLATFSRPGHAEAAATMVGEVRRVAPDLAAGTRIQTSESGSMVVYGRYDDPTDAGARRDLELIKERVYEGRPLFPRAMLGRVDRSGDATGRFSLRAVRRQYPNVDPLYTLQVAVWGDFDGGMSRDERRRRAEAHAGELRVQGFDAYVDHDDARGLSVVTIGLFDRTAVDPQSGLMSPDVERLMRRFPEHLVNGEPLLEPIDRRNPSRGTKVQRPRLVEVPRE
ncbi:MAG: hypothetical protein ACYTG1_02645 [Planctomycetota bacterium]|jgi:hypothetical protein